LDAEEGGAKVYQSEERRNQVRRFFHQRKTILSQGKVKQGLPSAVKDRVPSLVKTVYLGKGPLAQFRKESSPARNRRIQERKEGVFSLKKNTFHPVKRKRNSTKGRRRFRRGEEKKGLLLKKAAPRITGGEGRSVLLGEENV